MENFIKVQWKITNKCNLHCKHCYLGDLDGYEMSLKNAMQITDNIINSNVMEVTLTGGECLTYREIENIISKLLENDIKVDIFTNALLLKKVLSKINKFIQKKDLLLFYVSIDGLKKSHEKIRGKHTFDGALEGIKYAISNGYAVTTNTVINKINYDDIIDMIVLLKNIGVKDIQLSNLILQGNATKELAIDLKKQLSLKNKLRELYMEHPEFGYIYYSEIPDESGIRKVYSIDNGGENYIGNDNWKCTAGVARVTIDPNGKVFCCPFIKDSYLGDLNTQSISEVWDNINRFKFLKKLSEENSDRVCLAIKEGRKGVKNDSVGKI